MAAMAATQGGSDFTNVGGMLVQMFQVLQKELKVDKLSPRQKKFLVGSLVLGVPYTSYLLKTCVGKVRKEQQVLWRTVKASQSVTAGKDKERVEKKSGRGTTTGESGKSKKDKSTGAATAATSVVEKGSGVSKESKPKSKKKRIAVDALFFKRLCKILSVCVPGFFSKEMLLILTQGGLLVGRSILTDLIAEQEGAAGSALINQHRYTFLVHLCKFCIISVPASITNSGLKMFQKFIEVRFRDRLGVYLHDKYLNNKCYYQASTQVKLSNIDQRLTEDVENFAVAISELYNHTLKPLLDVVLFTRSLSAVMGYRTQGILYGYFFFVALTLKSISPPLSLMHAQEAGLSGDLRGAHHRLVGKTEEVAYNDPPGAMTEQLILNKHLRTLLKYTSLTSFQKFLQQIADQYLVKYGASCVALSVYAMAIFVWENKDSDKAVTAKNYIRSMRLLQNTSKGTGDLILVYKRITKLAGHTSRVAELLEEIEDMQNSKNREANFYGSRGIPDVCKDPNRVAELEITNSKTGKKGDSMVLNFEKVTICSPDGTALVKDLSFTLNSSKDSVLITGPNGSGKSSLVRVLAGLWPLAKGKISRPSHESIFFLSQRPYLVSGSLRDQLMYPHPSSRLIASSSKHDKQITRKASKNSPMVRDRDLKDALAKVEIAYLLDRYSLDSVVNWEETLSGGEKQRVAMARLLCHKPKFAILDECTSAVSADGEEKLYQLLVDEGISFLSIAHRAGVKKYHKRILTFDGSLQGSGWSMNT